MNEDSNKKATYLEMVEDPNQKISYFKIDKDPNKIIIANYLHSLFKKYFNDISYVLDETNFDIGNLEIHYYSWIYNGFGITFDTDFTKIWRYQHLIYFINTDFSKFLIKNYGYMCAVGDGIGINDVTYFVFIVDKYKPDDDDEYNEKMSTLIELINNGVLEFNKKITVWNNNNPDICFNDPYILDNIENEAKNFGLSKDDLKIIRCSNNKIFGNGYKSKL